MNLSLITGLLAGITILVAYGFYLKQAIKGQSTPNPSSWAIWLIVGIINTITYFSVVNNIWQTLIAGAVTFSVAVIFVYSFWKGKFTKIKTIEKVIFVLTVIIGIFWQITSNDRVSNLILQFIYMVSYFPTVNGILNGSAKEYPVSWIIAIIAYFLSTISVLSSFNGDWISFLFPMANGLLGNGFVVFLIWYKKHKKEKKRM